MIKIVPIIFVLFLSGCVGPAKIEPIEEIATNETAFLVPLEGATKSDQQKFMSIEYLETSKVAAKRITIPIRQRDIGRMWWEYEWIPTMKVIKIDRSPVSREWTVETGTCTKTKNEAIELESLDSIGFSIGITITALVSEDNASKFLYYYAGKQLSNIIDENVRSYISSILSREFNSRKIEDCKNDKRKIMEIAQKEVTEYFSKMGITICNLGMVEGMNYTDKEIQDSINKVNKQELAVKEAAQKLEEKKKLNEIDIQVNSTQNTILIQTAQAQKDAAELFAKAQEAIIKKTELEIEVIKAEAMKIAATKWNGQSPNMVTSGSGFLFNLDSMKFNNDDKINK